MEPFIILGCFFFLIVIPVGLAVLISKRERTNELLSNLTNDSVFNNEESEKKLNEYHELKMELLRDFLKMKADIAELKKIIGKTD